MEAERKNQNKKQRRSKRRRRVITAEQRRSKPSTDEFQVARWVKTCFKMQTSRLLNTEAPFFSSSHLIDRLLDTSFAMGDCALFTNREEAADFLHLMLAHDFFHRIMKPDIPVNKKNKQVLETYLQLHPDQTFIDDPGEFYVWAYEPLCLGNWSTLFLLYFSLASLYIVHYWPDDVEITPSKTSLVGCTLFFMYMIMTLLRLALFYLVRWITNETYEFMILPNLCKTVPFHKSLWPLFHFKNFGNQSITLKPNHSFDFYYIAVGMFVLVVFLHVMLGFVILYIFSIKTITVSN